MTTTAATSRWFTCADGADADTVAAVWRGALAAQRHRIEHLSIDVVSDEPWPAEVSWAVAELQARLDARRHRARPWWLRLLPRERGPTVGLSLSDDHDFELATAIAPFTIGGTGLSDGGRIIWDANDTGTSGAFHLTEAEADEVRRYLESRCLDPAALVVLRNGR